MIHFITTINHHKYATLSKERVNIESGPMCLAVQDIGHQENRLHANI